MEAIFQKTESPATLAKKPKPKPSTEKISRKKKYIGYIELELPHLLAK